MLICHGSGNAATDGCCYVNGAVCPLRWKLINGHVFDASGTDLGTVDAFIRSYVGNNPQRQQRVKDQLQGVVIVCSAAIDVIAADPTVLTNRAAFESAWNTHAGYLAKVRPAWAAIEQREGWAPGSYQCSTWTGRLGPECCFAETQAANDAGKAGMTSTAVTLRTGGGRV